MDLTFDCIGNPGYGVSFRNYVANIPLANFTTTALTQTLFVIPKGATVVSAKAEVTEETDGSVAMDIGTYAITTAGAVGSAIDADDLYDGIAVTSSSDQGTILAKAATALGIQLTQDAVVQAVATITTAATKGTVRIEVVTIP